MVVQLSVLQTMCKCYTSQLYIAWLELTHVWFSCICPVHPLLEHNSVVWSPFYQQDTYLFSGSSNWSVVEQHIYQERIQNTDELQQCLLTIWNKHEQQITDNAVNQWRDRLAACVREEGGHFEHTL